MTLLRKRVRGRTIKRVEHNPGPAGQVPTPEVLAGQEVKRLRKLKGWSQEEVARRMAAYGFESWHQTTVGRTESAARPLRLNEASALAAMFEVPVTQLLVPHSLRVDQIDEDIRVTLEQRAELARSVDQLRPTLDQLEEHQQRVSDAYRKATAGLEWADTHVKMLQGIRRILTSGADIPPELLSQVTGIHELVARRDIPEKSE